MVRVTFVVAAVAAMISNAVAFAPSLGKYMCVCIEQCVGLDPMLHKSTHHQLAFSVESTKQHNTMLTRRSFLSTHERHVDKGCISNFCTNFPFSSFLSTVT